MSAAATTALLSQPIAQWRDIGRPEQQYVISTLTQKISFDPNLSYRANQENRPAKANSVTEAYYKRLEMELINIAAEQMIRDNQDLEQVAILEQILDCEAGFWQ